VTSSGFPLGSPLNPFLTLQLGTATFRDARVTCLSQTLRRREAGG
jgi:hypothetical protein